MKYLKLDYKMGKEPITNISIVLQTVYILQNFVLWQFDLLLPQFKLGGNDIKNCLECFREPKKGK